MQSLWIQFAIEILTPVLLALGSLLAAYAVAFIRSHVTHVQSRDALMRGTAAVEIAVGETYQTMVDGLRQAASDGKITDGEAKQALAVTLSSARDYLGPKGVAAFRKALGSDDQALDRWLVGAIEAEVRRQRGAKS